MRELRLLSIEVTPKGFAFAILEREQLVDWGGREVSGDVSVFLHKLDALVRQYRPDVIVLEEPADSRRSRRSIEWLAWAEELAQKREIEARTLTWESLQHVFAIVGTTRYEIACAIAEQFPELAPDLPPQRQPWQHESPRLGVFIAVARALAFNHLYPQLTATAS